MSDAQSLIDALLEAGPRKRHDLHMQLIGLVRDDPAVVDTLPKPWEIEEGGPRYESSALWSLSFIMRADVGGFGAFLERVDPLWRAGALNQVANIENPRCLHVEAAEIVGGYLGDANPSVRSQALYFFQRYANHRHPEVEPWAERFIEMLRDTAPLKDADRYVSVVARRTVQVCAKVDAEVMEAAARALLGRPGQSKLRRVVGEVLPRALKPPEPPWVHRLRRGARNLRWRLEESRGWVNGVLAALLLSIPVALVYWLLVGSR